MPIFWVAIEELPTKQEQEEQSLLPKLLVVPTAVEARDDKDAALKVAIDHPMLKGINRDKLQVLVRPF